MTTVHRAGKSFYHAVAHASVVFIQAALSFDRVSVSAFLLLTQISNLKPFQNLYLTLKEEKFMYGIMYAKSRV